MENGSDWNTSSYPPCVFSSASNILCRQQIKGFCPFCQHQAVLSLHSAGMSLHTGARRAVLRCWQTREVFGNVTRAGWSQDLLSMVALPSGGSCWAEGGGTALLLCSCMAEIPGTDTLGAAVCSTQNKSPKPHRLIRLKPVWGSICCVLGTAKVTKSRSPTGSYTVWTNFFPILLLTRKYQFVFLRNTEDARE